MKLHENNELFTDAILATSQLLDLPEIYIEKDYWITVALHEIFHSSMANQTVFKGGTALSKCNKLIERFSTLFYHKTENYLNEKNRMILGNTITTKLIRKTADNANLKEQIILDKSALLSCELDDLLK